jgi:autotransporter-associated beta strand protein
LLGLDISAWQGNISQTTWNNIRTNEDRYFVILRSSRGGTTGFYNQNNAYNTNPPAQNTLSQRYDDPYFVQNVNRATAAGMFVGTYHFSRPDIVETNLTSNGIRNSGTNEADHFIEMAGAWMRPGYLLPVHDLEAGELQRTDAEMAQFSIDFSNQIYDRMGIRPAIYTSGNYAANVIGGASATLRNQIARPQALAPTNAVPSIVSPCYPTLWSARWPNGSGNQYTGNIQTDQPTNGYPAIYGPWDDYGVTHPWTFWQYSSGERLQSFNNGGSNLDANAVRGGIEFLKDQLIPAVWMNNGDGDWSTLTNWNSGQTPVAPVTGPGQVAPVGTQTLPTARLPGAAGTGPTSGQNDTVILERPNANITVTLSAGTHNIRKLYMREALNITGGSLTVNYVPSADSTTNGAQFSGPVNLSGGSLSVHTLQVDAAQTFTVSGGSLTFDTLKLMPGGTPAKLALTGNPIFNPLGSATATLSNVLGAASPGFLDLSNGTRTITVGNGVADVDVSLEVPLSNGALTKAGPGTMRLTAASTYAGGTTITGGRLLVNNPAGSGTGSGAVGVGSGGTLGGTGTISGAVTVNSGGVIAPGTSIGTLTLNSAPALGGATVMEVDRNGGAPLADKLVLTSIQPRRGLRRRRSVHALQRPGLFRRVCQFKSAGVESRLELVSRRLAGEWFAQDQPRSRRWRGELYERRAECFADSHRQPPGRGLRCRWRSGDAGRGESDHHQQHDADDEWRVHRLLKLRQRGGPVQLHAQ